MKSMPNCPTDFAKITYFKSGIYMLRIILYIPDKHNGLTAYKKKNEKKIQKYLEIRKRSAQKR
jgi:hypothetical protein